MTTQHEMLGVANQTGIPVQQSQGVPTQAPNMQTVQNRWQWFGVNSQANYDQMHGSMQEPVVQQQQQPQYQQPQWSQPQQAVQTQPQPQAPIQQQPQAPVQQPVNQPVSDQPAQVPAPEQESDVVPEVSEEEKQKIADAGEQKKADIKEEAASNPDEWKEVLLEKLIDEWNQAKVDTLQATKESEAYKRKMEELASELNELKYNSNSIAMAEQWRWLAMVANKYYSNTEDNTSKEKYIGKILNTLGDLTWVNAFEVFNGYVQGWKRVVANMSGATWATAQNPQGAAQPQYKPQGVVKKSGGKRRRF